MKKNNMLLTLAGILMSGMISAQVLTGRLADQVVQGADQVLEGRNTYYPAHVVFRKGEAPAFADAANLIREKLQAGNSFGLLKKSMELDPLGYAHYRYIQTVNGIPVIGSMYLLHVKNGQVESMNGELYSNLDRNKKPLVNEPAALAKALQFVNASVYKWQVADEERWLKAEQQNPSATYYPKGRLVYAPDTKQDAGYRTLAYEFDIYAHEPMSRKLVFVDAVTGEVISSEDKIHVANATGTAVTGYSGTQTIITDYTGSTYRLRETGRGLGIETYNLQKGTSYAAAVDFTDADNYWNNVNANKDQYATDAHFAAEKTYDYYYSTFGRNSIDNNGLKLLSYIHYSTNYVNAFWDGTRMTYGDGNASYNPLVTLDIGGHEITHGLTSYTANLTYSNQSGALNESFSDIFGETIEGFARGTAPNWLMGSEIGSAFRSFINPNAYSQPDTYLGTYWYTGTGDNGGVHTNSGVQNFWYYLLVNGGSGTNDISNAYNVSAIGINKAAAIAYRTLTVYLSPSSQYADARYYSIIAATDLYGVCSAEVQAVTNAWYAVGVGSAYSAAVVASFNANITTSCTVPLTVQFTNSSTNATNAQWSFGDGGTSTALNPTYTYNSAGTYTVTLTASSSCGTNTLTRNAYIIINTPAAPNTTGASRCSSGSVTLGASGSGTLYWYDQPTGGSQVNTGTTFITPSLNNTTTYYVENRVNQTSSNVGPANTSIGAGGLHNNATAQYLIFDVYQPCTLVSVFVNSGAAGTRNVILWNSAGTVLQTIPVNFPSGNATITLNMPLTPGTGYRLGGSSMNLYRNTAGAVYPYTLSNLVSITGNSAGGGYYYYFYNWLVQPSPCISSRTPVIATINTPPTVTMNPINPVCVNNAPFALFGGSPLGGTYSGTGVSNGIFNPGIGAGNYTISYSFTDDKGCSNSASTTLTVNNLPVVNAGSYSPVCANAATVTLNGSPAGGSFSGTGVSGNTFNPAVGAGTYSITYMYSDVNGCSNSASTSITVNAVPTVNAGTYPQTCINNGLVTLSGSPSGGIFTGTGVSGNTFNPAVGAGTYTITYQYTNANGCSNSASTTIKVNSLPVVSAGNYSPVCNNGGLVTLNGNPSGGVFSGTGVSGSSFDPSIGAGIYTINYAYTDANGCSNSASTSITVNSLPVVSAGSYSPVCNNGGLVTLNGNPSGGVFTGQGVTGNNFDPSIGAGIYPISYSYTDANGCSNSSTASITVNNCSCTTPATPGSISQSGGASKVCPGETRTYKITAVPNASSYLWTLATGMSFVSGQGTNQIVVLFDNNLAASNIISVVAQNACGSSAPQSKTVSKNIPATPSAIAGNTFGVCNSSNVPYSVTNVSGITYNWSFDVGTAGIVSGQGSNSVMASFQPGFTTGKLSVTAGNLCGTSNPRTLTIKSTPATSASITGSATVCANQQGVPYSCDPVAGAVSYTWSAPSGSRISDGTVTSTTASLTTTSTSVTVNFKTTAGNVSVKANNSCGSGSAKQFAVSITCRAAEIESMNQKLMVVPNPSHDRISVSFFSENETTASLMLSDMTGRVLHEEFVQATTGINSVKMDIASLAAGIYSVILKDQTGFRTTKLLVEK